MLSHLYDEYQLLNDVAFCEDRTALAVTKRHSVDLVSLCEQKGFILRRGTCFAITPLGLERHTELLQHLSQAQQHAQQEANEEARDHRNAARSWWQFLLGLLIGWLLGCFTPQEVWNVIFTFFH